MIRIKTKILFTQLTFPVYVIQLQFKTHAESWIESLCRDDFAIVKILSLKKQSQSGHVTHFVDISSDKVSADRMEEELRNSKDVDVSDVAKVGTNRLVGAVTSNNCSVCSVIVDTNVGYFIGPATTGADCQTTFKLFMNGEGIPTFLQGLHTNQVQYKISDITRLAPKRSLTSRQERVLKSALELGYYDYPKRVTTEELSRSLDIAPSTVAEILRRAEKRIISGYFEEN